jgi:hypothetical protein
LRVEFAGHAPDFVALRIEEDKGWGEFKTVYGAQFHACLILNVQADDVDLIAKFLFELVNDGLNRGAANSIGRLEFEQDRRACPNHGLHFFCIFHQRGLARVQDAPGGNQPQDDDAKGEVVIPFGFVGQQDEACNDCKHNGYDNKGILVGDYVHNSLGVGFIFAEY